MPNPENIEESMLFMQSLGSSGSAQSVVITRAGARVAVRCGDRSALCASYAVAMATAYAMAFQ